MNKLFVDDLVSELEMSLECDVEVTDQSGVKEILSDYKDDFPMVCFEYTEDSQFEVDFDESIFLNDSSHEGTWIVGRNDDGVLFVINLLGHGMVLEIDTIEVNYNQRGQNIGRNVVDVVELEGEKYYKHVEVSPFDTSAMNFWERMEYEEGMNGYWIKDFD